MAIRIVCGLTVEIFNSIGVEDIERAASGIVGATGLTSAMVPAEITARRASLRVKWSLIPVRPAFRLVRSYRAL